MYQSFKLHNRNFWLEIFLHSCASSLVFEKECFCNLTSLFCLKKWPHSDKSNQIVWEYVKNKSRVAIETYLDFADINGYFTFKVSAWKKICTIFVELQKLQTFLESSYKVLPRKVKTVTLQRSVLFYGLLNFLINFIKSLITFL